MRFHLILALFATLFLTYVELARAGLGQRQQEGQDDHSVMRRLAFTFPSFDIFSPQGQARAMLHCLGQGPTHRANTDKVVQWMQSNPPTQNNADPNAVFALNPLDWGFHGFHKRSGQLINNWRRDGKSATLQRRLDADRQKLLMCNDKLRSQVNQGSSRPARQNNTTDTNVQSKHDNSEPADATTKGQAVTGTAHDRASVEGNSASTSDTSSVAPDGKPLPPGLGKQHTSVTPVLDPSQKLLPEPGAPGRNTSSSSTSNTQTMPLTNGAPAADFRSPGCRELVDRPEYGTLTVEQKTAFIDAVKCVRQKPSRYNHEGMNAFDDWVLLHIQMLKYVHFTAYFLVFHRAMLAAVENDLRQCGLPFGLPWFDWTKYASDGGQAPIFDSDPNYGFGSNGQGTADKCPYGSGKQVLDGAFANTTFNAPFEHSLCRQFNNMDVQQPNPHWGNNCTVFLTERFNAGLLSAHNQGKFFDFASALEISAHTAVHTCLGGNMPWLSSSANDLTFYVHHAWVDRQFGIWQSQSDSNKYAFQGPKKQTRNGARPPWDAAADDVMNLRPLAPNVKVSDVLDPQSGKMDGLMCYRYTS